MFYSNYLPVNIGRKNEIVYTENATFPVPLLLLAKQALTENSNCGGKVLVEEGTVSFTEEPSYHWSIPDIFLACEAYDTAVKNKFSFYTVMNNKGIPQLFISKEFKRCRILVSAFTFKSVLVTKPNLVRKISCMIDHKYDNLYCMNLFDVISKEEANKSQKTEFIDAIIINRGMEDEYMVVNPIKTLYTDNTYTYGTDLIEEMRQLINNEAEETESLLYKDGCVIRKDLSYWTPMSVDHCKNMVAMYDKYTSKKNNYIPLVGDDLEAHLYISTNWMYLINAATLECIKLNNAYLKKLVQCYAVREKTPTSELTMCWMLANTEKTSSYVPDIY